MNNPKDNDKNDLTEPALDWTNDSDLGKFLEKLIDKLVKKMDEDSYKPRVNDLLKIIQLTREVAKTADQKSFWDMIEEVRQEELPKMYPDENSLESLIKAAIYSLRFEVKNGIVSVKAITDAYNLGRSEETRLTYQRMGRLLNQMGFVKAKTSNGCSAIFWNDSLLSPKVHLLDEKNKNSSPETPETPDTPETPVGSNHYLFSS
jgi:polyhydroxyalkanoate synthesis regulator phasin